MDTHSKKADVTERGQRMTRKIPNSWTVEPPLYSHDKSHYHAMKS